MGESKFEVATAVYKVHVHCGQCARDIETEFTEYQGVLEVKLDAGAGKVTVKGVGFDAEKLRAKVEKGCRKKVELIPPPKNIVTEVKIKKEELKIITVKVPLHCPECAIRVQEILLEHKSIYAAKTNLGKNTCVVEGVLEEKKLAEYIFRRTRKHCIIEKVEKKEIVLEEKVEVKKKKSGEEEEAVKVVEAVKEKVKEVVAPYFIPCTHPQFIDYSHPWHRRCGGGDCYSPWEGGYGYGGCGYQCSAVSYTHPGLSGYQDTSFLHCSHPNEFLSEENPHACSVM